MSLPNGAISGIVEVMDRDEHRTRGEGLGTALDRLARARELRGPVGMLDPFHGIDQVDPSSFHEEDSRATRRRGLFRFSDRARAAVEA